MVGETAEVSKAIEHIDSHVEYKFNLIGNEIGSWTSFVMPSQPQTLKRWLNQFMR